MNKVLKLFVPFFGFLVLFLSQSYTVHGKLYPGDCIGCTITIEEDISGPNNYQASITITCRLAGDGCFRVTDKGNVETIGCDCAVAPPSPPSDPVPRRASAVTGDLIRKEILNTPGGLLAELDYMNAQIHN